MSVSNAQALTAQFYEWERLGRGWQIAPFSCDLEAPFVPFFGHFLEDGEIIDDGKVPSFWESVMSRFSPVQEAAIAPKEKETIAYPYSGSDEFYVYAITFPKQAKPALNQFEQLLIMLSYRKSPVSFEIIATEHSIALQWTVRDIDAEFFYSQLKAFFPECGIIEATEDNIEAVLQEASHLYTVDFGLEHEFMRPVMTHGSFDHDPYTPLFGILERLLEDEAVIVQVLFSGVHNAWGESIITAVCDNSLKQSFFGDAPEMPQLAKEKVCKPLYGVTLRAVTVASSMHDASILLRDVSTAIVHASASRTNALMPLSGTQYTVEERLVDILTRQTHRVGMLLNVSELATFVHFPTAIRSKKMMQGSQATKAVPDWLLGHSYCLGLNQHQGIEALASISTEQRLRHIHIMGATGTGKSTLLKSLIMQDVNSGMGIMCLDPHGDLIDDLLDYIPEHRIQDVVLIDPSDTQFPTGLNILSAHTDIEKELLASDLVALFRRFSTSWGDQMNSVLANAILAFVYNTKVFHLGDLRKFLIEIQFRAQILSTVSDPEIVYYWQHEFPILKGNSIASILTRLDAFLRPKVIRNMVCQTQSLDFAQMIDTNKIVLVKLSQGLIGNENSYLLGAFIVSKLQQTAMARQVQLSNERIPFFCYIDEFQHFITPSMASILSGARKFGLGLVLSHQDMQQVSSLNAEIANSILANAGTRICFRLGDNDAKKLEDGFSSFSSQDLQNLSVGEAIARVNTTDADFNLEVMQYDEAQTIDFRETIQAYSRTAYSVPITASEPPRPEETKQPEQEKGESKKKPVATSIDEPADNAETIREHRYIQTFIKALSEGQGYKASIEVPTPDGTGQIDVLLEKGEEVIAVEISVTTTPEWELHNIQKCLAAGCTVIVVCSNNTKKLTQVESLVQKEIKKSDHRKIRYCVPDKFHTLLSQQSPPQETHTLMKGYRVKVQYEEDGTSKQELLQSIINASKKA